MHFKPHEFAGLQEFLQELTHVLQMGKRRGGASVALGWGLTLRSR